MIEYEIAPAEYWQELTLADGRFYCFSLNIDGKSGWRFPTVSESCFLYINKTIHNMALWNQADLDESPQWEPEITFLLIPVRDLV